MKHDLLWPWWINLPLNIGDRIACQYEESDGEKYDSYLEEYTVVNTEYFEGKKCYKVEGKYLNRFGDTIERWNGRNIILKWHDETFRTRWYDVNTGIKIFEKFERKYDQYVNDEGKSVGLHSHHSIQKGTYQLLQALF